MARQHRIEFAGAIYHVASRGNAQIDIYRDHADRLMFFDVMSQVIERFSFRFLSYCLMGNHYHALIETPRGNLSRGMRQLNGVYAQRFNKRHKRHGHLYEGRYWSNLIRTDAQLLACFRYIARNPVEASLTTGADDWRWSAHRARADAERPVP
jgi:putative transposase